ncbi:hypothetical protein J1TS1_18050 [Shouchella clausii]|jgi:hypothetical protein|uniref:hypothetical protein n=1 Tax=Shouchella clausii TaxID=79880 RepID=UPI0007993CFB|nr:hypothetical protein WZ76_09425 [Shouchella clausii]GIN07660.1 hypothetical protein J1TS1_18050 [Shouchella clausii]
MSVDNDPADSNVIIFRQFIVFEGFTASWDTAIHITIEKIATIERTSVDILNTSYISKFSIHKAPLTEKLILPVLSGLQTFSNHEQQHAG